VRVIEILGPGCRQCERATAEIRAVVDRAPPTAISLPECIILKEVIKTPPIVVFATIVTVGILLIGYLFNFLIR
jgi:hypothetical protein